MAGLQTGEDRMMIDSVIWAQTHIQTATSPYQMLLQRSVRQAAKTAEQS